MPSRTCIASANAYGVPTSLTIDAVSRSVWRSMTSASRVIAALRSAGLVRAQPGKARRAAWTASSTWPRDAIVTVAVTCSVAGLTASTVSP
jgi:hypothetical protein